MSRLFTLLKLPAAAAMCPLCKDGTRETTEHFVLHCPSLEPERVAFLTRLRHVMQQLGTPGEHVLRSFRTDPFALLDAALGGLPQLPAGHGSLQEQRLDKELRAQTLWAFDKVVKNFVMILWRTRKATVGSYTIADKCLVHTPPGPEVCAVAEAEEYNRFAWESRSRLRRTCPTSPRVLEALDQACGNASKATASNQPSKELLSRMGGSPYWHIL